MFKRTWQIMKATWGLPIGAFLYLLFFNQGDFAIGFSIGIFYSCIVCSLLIALRTGKTMEDFKRDLASEFPEMRIVDAEEIKSYRDTLELLREKGLI